MRARVHHALLVDFNDAEDGTLVGLREDVEVLGGPGSSLRRGNQVFLHDGGEDWGIGQVLSIDRDTVTVEILDVAARRQPWLDAPSGWWVDSDGQLQTTGVVHISDTVIAGDPGEVGLLENTAVAV